VRQYRNPLVSTVRLALTAALTATSLLAQQSSAPPSEAKPRPAETAPAQPPPAQQTPPQPAPRFTTEANYVRVDVYPSKDGVPVLDLRAEDFEVQENGVRQKIQAFERVVVSPAGPQSMRVEPNSVREGEQMAANPRNRVFAIFLDIPHVDVTGSYRIKEPLIRLLDRILGPDDLVAVMTPEMSAAQVTFGRKTEVIADMLRDKWYWGVRHSIQDMDEREKEYDRCFPVTDAEMAAGMTRSGVTAKLIARRRERMVLDSLHDLVRYLGSVREERKAILALSNGWTLFRPDSSITQLRVVSALTGATEPVPGNEPIGVDPYGKLKVGAGRDREGYPISQTTCDKDRMFLASIDDDDYFRHLLDVANRNNASFYPIDPRGLAAFDSDIGPDAPPTIRVDMANLTRRIEVLRTLADNTDGIATVNSNDLDRGLKRIADDLSSYYLLGYYSTNTKLDGQFRRISVKVNRPGIEVRARRGYRAATVDEMNASRAAAAAPVPDLTRTTTAALGKLARLQPGQRFVIHTVPVLDATGSRINAVWVAGETVGPLEEFARGGKVNIVRKGGATAGGVVADVKPGERAFLVRMPIEQADATSVDLDARLTPVGDGIPLSETMKVAADPGDLQPLLFKRGLSTGNRVQPVASFQFSRTDRLQLQLPITATAKPGAGRMLDRNAQPLQIPVQVAEKKDDDGQRWLTADATLSALGAGDYVIEVTLTENATERRVLTAIRVTR
jgi:VWFA-related protein